MQYSRGVRLRAHAHARVGLCAHMRVRRLLGVLLLYIFGGVLVGLVYARLPACVPPLAGSDRSS